MFLEDYLSDRFLTTPPSEVVLRVAVDHLSHNVEKKKKEEKALLLWCHNLGIRMQLFLVFVRVVWMFCPQD